MLILFFRLPEATLATAEKENSNRTLRYVHGRAAVEVSYYVAYLLGRSAKSWHAEEINLRFLEQCNTVASEKRSLS